MGVAATLGEIGSKGVKGPRGARSPILEHAVSTSTVPDRRSHAPSPQGRSVVDVVVVCALEPAFKGTYATDSRALVGMSGYRSVGLSG
jgi:hypothetical protein